MIWRCLTVSVFMIFLASPASSQTIPQTFFGMSTNYPGNVTVTVPYGMARSWDTNGVSWSDSNSASGVYNFSNIDAFLAANAAQVPNIIYTLGRTPAWAASHPPGYLNAEYGAGQCAPPVNLAYWDNYIRALVIHAAGRIKYWELWNEPQNIRYYCGTIPQMVLLAQHAATIIKSIDPSAVIISPGTAGGAPAGSQWLSQFLSAGGGRYIDEVGFHGYDNTTAESIVNDVPYYKNVMQAHGIATKPLIDTEASWANVPSFTISQRAAFLSKYYLLQWSLGVSSFVWYAYDGTDWGRLIDTSNNPTGAATAYAQVNTWMVGATMSTPCSVDVNNIWSCGFSRSNGYVAEAVWNSTSSMSVTVDPQYIEYRDLTGQVTPITNNTVTIGSQPILLENKSL